LWNVALTVFSNGGTIVTKEEMAQEKLKSYIPLVEFLSKCYGENVEVVLHSVSDLDHSTIAIYNNHVSERKLGAPMTYFGLKIIRDKLYQTMDYTYDKKNVLDNGKILRSSTFFIKDDDGELIGTICVNVDVSSFVDLSLLFEKLAYGKGATDEVIRPPAEPLNLKETFPATVDDLIDATIVEFVGDSGSVEHLTSERKIELVKKLDEKGIFMFKGTVKKVSHALGVSEPTVYRYRNTGVNL